MANSKEKSTPKLRQLFSRKKASGGIFSKRKTNKEEENDFISKALPNLPPPSPGASSGNDKFHNGDDGTTQTNSRLKESYCPPSLNLPNIQRGSYSDMSKLLDSRFNQMTSNHNKLHLPYLKEEESSDSKVNSSNFELSRTPPRMSVVPELDYSHQLSMDDSFLPPIDFGTRIRISIPPVLLSPSQFRFKDKLDSPLKSPESCDSAYNQTRLKLEGTPHVKSSIPDLILPSSIRVLLPTITDDSDEGHDYSPGSIHSVGRRIIPNNNEDPKQNSEFHRSSLSYEKSLSAIVEANTQLHAEATGRPHSLIDDASSSDSNVTIEPESISVTSRSNLSSAETISPSNPHEPSSDSSKHSQRGSSKDLPRNLPKVDEVVPEFYDPSQFRYSQYKKDQQLKSIKHCPPPLKLSHSSFDINKHHKLLDNKKDSNPINPIQSTTRLREAKATLINSRVIYDIEVKDQKPKESTNNPKSDSVEVDSSIDLRERINSPLHSKQQEISRHVPTKSNGSRIGTHASHMTKNYSFSSMSSSGQAPLFSPPPIPQSFPLSDPEVVNVGNPSPRKSLGNRISKVSKASKTSGMTSQSENTMDLTNSEEVPFQFDGRISGLSGNDIKSIITMSPNRPRSANPDIRNRFSTEDLGSFENLHQVDSIEGNSEFYAQRDSIKSSRSPNLNFNQETNQIEPTNLNLNMFPSKKKLSSTSTKPKPKPLKTSNSVSELRSKLVLSPSNPFKPYFNPAPIASSPNRLSSDEEMDDGFDVAAPPVLPSWHHQPVEKRMKKKSSNQSTRSSVVKSTVSVPSHFMSKKLPSPPPPSSDPSSADENHDVVTQWGPDPIATLHHLLPNASSSHLRKLGPSLGLPTNFSHGDPLPRSSPSSTNHPSVPYRLPPPTTIATPKASPAELARIALVMSKSSSSSSSSNKPTSPTSPRSSTGNGFRNVFHSVKYRHRANPSPLTH